ncbi:MAG TPA: hypothetical protein VFJ82_00550 [Longimicrobium sp.]|nr:hypothetical protein [Longimicrobium sp.]
MPATLDTAALDSVRAELEAIDGVRRALLEGPPYTVYAIADRGAAGPTEMMVHAVLARHGLGPGEAEVHVSYLAAPEPRRRVRFVSARVSTPRTGGAHAAVELEWAGRTVLGEVEGESGYALELRLAAMATLTALDQVMDGRVKFQMVGIKPFRAFDSDVVVALVRSDVDGKSLIGAALAADDPYRAASVAVLNATNRILGNYLSNDEGMPAADS